jgi:hypothetical protein
MNNNIHIYGNCGRNLIVIKGFSRAYLEYDVRVPAKSNGFLCFNLTPFFTLNRAVS